MSGRRAQGTAGFSLLELSLAVALLGILALLGAAALGSSTARADRVKMAGTMRAMGAGILARAADHGGLLPGPLWPGQVAEYDPNRAGRLVVELAPYLGIEERTRPYVVRRLFTRSLERATRAIPAKDVRIFVMNMQLAGGALNPWGSLASSAPTTPLALAAVQALGRSAGPALSEADRTHPAVATAPWAASTAPAPAHGSPRLELFFDGSISQ